MVFGAIADFSAVQLNSAQSGDSVQYFYWRTSSVAPPGAILMQMTWLTTPICFDCRTGTPQRSVTLSWPAYFFLATAAAKLASASRRLYLPSSTTPIHLSERRSRSWDINRPFNIGRYQATWAKALGGVWQPTGIRVAGEEASPLDEGLALVVSGRNGEQANCAEDGRVAKTGGRGDDGVGDGVVYGRVLFLLDLENRAILEGPLHDVRVGRRALDDLGLGQPGPELGEVVELDEVPDIGEGRADDEGFGHGRARRDASGLGHGLRLALVMLIRRVAR